jgi:NitT/TauT family transport system ATP-binding protein
MLRIDNVAHTFIGPDGPVEALGPVAFQVQRGSFVCLVGPSGCGKSTLLRIIGGLLRPTQGTVSLDGAMIDEPQPRVGLVFQQSNLMPWRTVLDNLALPLELAGSGWKQRLLQANTVLERVGLGGFGQAYPAELSGGMAQRVAIGRALIQDPDVLLLDEPLGALDALTREQMQLELMNLWAAEHKTAIMVTHSITEAVFVADRVLVMSRRPGQIRADLKVPLARPRNLDMIHAPDFGTLVHRIREAIGAEYVG